MKNTLKWINSVLGRKRGYVLAFTLIQVVFGFTGVINALLMRGIVDSATARDLSAFWKYVLILGILMAVLLFSGAFFNWFSTNVSNDVEILFKKRLTDNVFRKDFGSVNGFTSGEWLTRLSSDVSVVSGGCLGLIPSVAGALIRLVSALVMIVALDHWFAFLLIPSGIAMVLASYFLRGIMKRLHKNVQESDGRMRTFFLDRLGSLMVIKAFAAERQTSDGMWEKMQDLKGARMKSTVFSIFCGTGFQIAVRGTYLIGLIYCACGIISGTVTYGTLTAILQLIGQVQGPFANLSGFVARFYAIMASAERLMEVEAFAEDCPEPVLEMQEVQAYYQEKFQGVELRNVKFTYPARTIDAQTQEGQAKETQATGAQTKEAQAGLEKEAFMPPVLRDFSLSVRKKEYVAFTGHSGCGKSTVLKLLTCLYPLDAGERVLVGVDGTIPLTSKWRRLFAYVPQGNQLMSGKVRDVVAFACPEESTNDVKLMQALSIACADEFLPELENGLDTELGEHGFGLSEGQTQRIAIARAIFADSPVLLLDEATSALDEATEAKLLENLKGLTDKTVIIVTHRKAALSICDRVLAFSEDGVEEA
ncbi:MAG: ABC transporter ATP-binding protein [Lachnospiraceae bacterium]|nr:ABC transporter ATP-binding protein [Lachnospiraceae bacterium]